MANMGNVTLDRDAVYINLPSKGVQFTGVDEAAGAFEANVASLGLTEGRDYFHFN